MIKPQYNVFITWFLIVLAGIYLTLTVINYYVDPFFKYFKEENSISDYGISRPFNEILLKMSLHKDQNANKYIFGDSRGNVFSREILNNEAPGEWYNFSVGGASPLEVISLIDYTIDTMGKDKVEEVIIVLPIRLFVNRRLDRFSEVNELLENDFLYLTNTLVLKASIANLIYLVNGKQIKSQKQSGSKKAVWDKWVKHARLKTFEWQLPLQIMDRYSKLFERLRLEEIPFTILLPPIHNDIQTTYSNGMPDVWQKYLSFFEQFPETRNCLGNSYTNQFDMFKDPYHSNALYSELVFDDIVNNQFEICVATD